MFEKLINNVQDKYKKYKEESSLYNDLLNKTKTLENLITIPNIDKTKITVSYKDILEICPDLNEQKALIIRGILPLNELYLTVLYAKECKTNIEYFLVPTNKSLWFIGTTNYKKIDYESINIQIIKNNIMSKILQINDILFEVNGNNQKIDDFLKLINEKIYRDNLILEKEKEFCGINPNLRVINELGTGISLDDKNNIVFHSKNFNYLTNIKEIINYELLLDDNVVIEKKSNRRVRLTANKNSCYQMNIRITTNKNSFILPIINKSAFNELYQATSSVFINGKKFAEKIINILDDLDENYLNNNY